MSKKQSLFLAALLLTVLALLIMYLGFTSAAKILWPPVITGVGFIIIAGVFLMQKKE